MARQSRPVRKSGGQNTQAKQSLGQNFLADEVAARRIVAAMRDKSEGGSRVIELGPGQGALTGGLLQAYPGMNAVELDQRMIQFLNEKMPDLSVERGDMLRLDFETIAAQRGGSLSLISNAPFYLTSKLLFKLIASAEHVDHAVFTMQLEVAEKILAPYGSKRYGILAVMLQLFGNPEHLFDIPPSAFVPAPKCHVAVVRFTPSIFPTVSADGLPKALASTATTGLATSAGLNLAQRTQLLALLKRVFEGRRKMLRVTLKPLLANAATPPPEEWLRMRPEQLPPEAFIELAAMIFGEASEGGGEKLLADACSPSGEWKSHKAGWNLMPQKERL